MSPYTVDKRDINFCLYEYLGLEEMCKLPKYSEFNRELFDMVIDEAIKFSVDVLAPLNIVLDREGVRYQDGMVRVPEACHQAYKKFCEGGWIAPSGDPEYGGQGLPLTLASAVGEIMLGASMAFQTTPGLTKVTGSLLETYGTEVTKTYIEKLYSGVWSGTMCLTEPGAGSAVGDLKCKAIKDGDHYLIEGEKIFITGGDQDMTENILHLVLARVEGAPKGIKGVSLFLIPKIRINDDGTLAEPNNVACGGIEHKMGMHGSPTCSLIFGGDGPCHGYLVGEENQGIRFMFQMMNEARIGVGLQGLCVSAASYQEALAYAKERVQGVDIMDMKNVDAPRVPIIKHPDVKRMLLTMKAFSEGMRAMLYFSARCSDLSEHAKDDEEKQKWTQMLELLTPICKAYCSDYGYDMTTVGIQVLGGYGYCNEYPQEQYARDSKAASIYEGTNAIQALDLLGRKVAGKGGLAFMTFLNHLNVFLDEHAKHPTLSGYVEKLQKARDTLTGVVMHFQKTGTEDPYYPILCATPFLEMFGHVVMSYFLLDMAILAEKKLSALPEGPIADSPEKTFYDGKLHSARFFIDTYLPKAAAIAETAHSGNRSPLEVIL
jgi:alkylation response protein AidB-like acyl-CoA dehydrogenase